MTHDESMKNDADYREQFLQLGQLKRDLLNAKSSRDAWIEQDAIHKRLLQLAVTKLGRVELDLEQSIWLESKLRDTVWALKKQCNESRQDCDQLRWELREVLHTYSELQMEHSNCPWEL